jgi:hypothetical protein
MIIKSHGLEHEVQLNFDRTPKSISHSSQSSNDKSSGEQVYNITEAPRENRTTQIDWECILTTAQEQQDRDRALILSYENANRGQKKERQDEIKKQEPGRHTAEMEQFITRYQKERNAARRSPHHCPGRVCVRGKQTSALALGHAKCVLHEEWLEICNKSRQIRRMGRHAPDIRWPMYYARRLFPNNDHPPSNIDCLKGRCFWDPDHGHQQCRTARKIQKKQLKAERFETKIRKAEGYHKTPAVPNHGDYAEVQCYWVQEHHHRKCEIARRTAKGKDSI